MVRKWLKYWLTYNLVREYHSPINGPMKVVMVMNMPRLIVGGLVQSGGLVRQIWDKAIGRLKRERREINQALIIGLGCGDCAFRIHKHYPEVKMVGVEIDPQIIDAAECYFNLAVLKNLSVVIDDGVAYVDKLLAKKKSPQFDLIVIDVYLGQDFPGPFRKKAFFKKLKKLLAPKGVVIFNHLFFGKHKKPAKDLVNKLDAVFTKISLQRTASNLLIFASSKD